MISRDHLVPSVRSNGLLRGIAASFELLTPVEKRQAIFLVFSMNINAILGLVGLAGILPFVHLMLSPDPLAQGSYFGKAFGAVGLTDVKSALIWVGFLIIGLVLFKNIFSLFHSWFVNKFCARVETRMATELLKRVIAAPYQWLITRNSSILRDVVMGQSIEWSRGIVRASLQLINDLLFLFVAFALLIAASPAAGLGVCAAALVLALGLVAISQPKIAYYNDRKRRAIHIAGVTAMEAIASGRDVRLSRAGRGFISSFVSDIQTYSTSEAYSRQWQSLPRLGIEVIGFAALIGVALGALLMGVTRADVAALLALYSVVAVRAIPIVSQVVTAISGIGSSLPSIDDVHGLLNDLPSASITENSEALPSWESLRFENACFRYVGGERPAIGPLNIVFERGRSYGIVGMSGAGKSTLVDLISGLLPPTSGKLLLDGKPLEDRRLSAWRSGVAYVAQTPFLLDATLADNIEFGEHSHHDRKEQLDRAIKAAGLSQMVATLPEGLATRLGERGIRLSGGQRQRVAIARALYRKAGLLVLDEATSALDSLTERDITDAIEALKGQITMVVVAHRISTVARLDEILVLDHGHVAGYGAHQDLLHSSDLYRNLVEAQSIGDLSMIPSLPG